MDYEKKYKEALNLAKSYYEKEDGGANQFLDTIFPELRESEDERIRTRLSEYFRGFLEGNEHCYEDGGYVKWEGLDVKSILTWLEKQKEQKLDGLKEDYSGMDDVERIIHRGFLAAGVENVPVTIIKETAQECLAQMKPAEWGEEDEKIRKALVWHLKADVDFVSNGVTKAECLAYLDKQKAQKQEWSEEDKRILKGIIGLVDHNQHYNVSNKEMLDWLKSLRPSWKPSKEQMDRLFSIVAALRKDYCDDMADFLASLYKQLKAL